MAEKIQYMAKSTSGRSRLNLGCGLFRDEVGTQLNSLRGVQGQLDLGGGFT